MGEKRKVEVMALHLKPRQTVIEYREVGDEMVELEREIRRVHDPEDGLIFVEFDEASYEGELTAYPTAATIEVLV
jgi:hypothetical protein